FESNVTVGGNNVFVPAGNVLSLNNSVYGYIQVDSGATVTFTDDEIDLDTLITGEDVTILFASPCVKMRIRNFIAQGTDNAFNADTAAELKVFVEESAHINAGSVVIADIYTLQTLSTGNSIPTNYTTMMGFFVADDVSGGAYTSWQWNQGCACDGSGG